jgi:hypothetical protein
MRSEILRRVFWRIVWTLAVRAMHIWHSVPAASRF